VTLHLGRAPSFTAARPQARCARELLVDRTTLVLDRTAREAKLAATCGRSGRGTEAEDFCFRGLSCRVTEDGVPPDARAQQRPQLVTLTAPANDMRSSLAQPKAFDTPGSRIARAVSMWPAGVAGSLALPSATTPRPRNALSGRENQLAHMSDAIPSRPHRVAAEKRRSGDRDHPPRSSRSCARRSSCSSRAGREPPPSMRSHSAAVARRRRSTGAGQPRCADPARVPGRGAGHDEEVRKAEHLEAARPRRFAEPLATSCDRSESTLPGGPSYH